MIHVWTDGSGVWDEKQVQPIGYATVIRIDEYVIEIAAWDPAGTNNTAELKAAVIGLQALNIEPCLRDGVTVHSDSEYVINQAQRKWKVNKNHELVGKLQQLSEERKANWVHVPGHSGDWGNERCDVLASYARKQSRLDPAKDKAAVVHCVLYHVSDPSKPLLQKGGQEVCEVFVGEECLRLKLLV